MVTITNLGPCGCCGTCEVCTGDSGGCSAIFFDDSKKSPPPSSVFAVLGFPKYQNRFTGNPNWKDTITYNADPDPYDTITYTPDWNYINLTYGVTIPTMDCETTREYTDPGPAVILTDPCDIYNVSASPSGSAAPEYSQWQCGFGPTCVEGTDSLTIELTRIPYGDPLPTPLTGDVESCCVYYGEAEKTFTFAWKGRRLTMGTFTSSPPFEVTVDYPNGWTESSGTVEATYRFGVMIVPCQGACDNGLLYHSLRTHPESAYDQVHTMLEDDNGCTPFNVTDGWVGFIKWEYVSGDDFDFDTLMPQDPKISDGTSNDFGANPSAFFAIEGISFCVPAVFSPQFLGLLNTCTLTQSGGTFSFELCEGGGAYLLDNSSAIRGICNDPVPLFTLAITEGVSSPSPLSFQTPPSRKLCHHLGRKLSPGTCKGNCRHVCDAYYERDDVRVHLDVLAERDGVKDAETYAIPNKTCRGCPGYEE